MRDCPFDGTPLAPDLGRDDEGEVRSVLRCAVCERGFDPEERWDPAKIRQRVAQVLEQERRGGI